MDMPMLWWLFILPTIQSELGQVRLGKSLSLTLVIFQLYPQ